MKKKESIVSAILGMLFLASTIFAGDIDINEKYVYHYSRIEDKQIEKHPERILLWSLGTQNWRPYSPITGNVMRADIHKGRKVKTTREEGSTTVYEEGIIIGRTKSTPDTKYFNNEEIATYKRTKTFSPDGEIKVHFEGTTLQELRWRGDSANVVTISGKACRGRMFFYKAGESMKSGVIPEKWEKGMPGQIFASIGLDFLRIDTAQGPLIIKGISEDFFVYLIDTTSWGDKSGNILFRIVPVQMVVKNVVAEKGFIFILDYTIQLPPQEEE